MINVTGLYRQSFCASPEARALRGIPAPESATEMLGQAGAMVPRALSQAGTVMLNWLAAWRCWWGGERRRIYRLDRGTAASLQTVGIGWLPDAPPATWEGRHLAYELATPTPGGLLGAAGYYARNSSGQMTLYVCYLRGDGAAVIPLAVDDVQRINRRILESGELVTAGWEDPGISAEVLRDGWEALQLLLALSYYAAAPDRLDVAETVGAAERTPDGRQEAGGDGRVVPTWRWADARIRPGYSAYQGGAGMDASGRVLMPTIVRAHLRRIGDDVRIIDPYQSHRWHSDGVDGTTETL